MKILFKTFGQGHLVSDKEFDKLKSGFEKNGMELFREGDNYDIVMVKAYSHTWDDIPKDKPIVMYSIGSEWATNKNIKELNEPIRELYLKANAVVNISEYCKQTMIKVFGDRDKNYVIIPANPINLPDVYPRIEPIAGPIKVAITAIPRPIKRVEETIEALKKINLTLGRDYLEIVSALGTVSDFSYYHNCHFYLQMSRKEGMPNTVLEALSYGLPCIVSNHGGAKEAVGNAGIVVQNDPGDDIMPDLENISPINQKMLEEAVYKMIKNIRDYGFKVRQRVIGELNDETTGKKFKEIFLKL